MCGKDTGSDEEDTGCTLPVLGGKLQTAASRKRRSDQKQKKKKQGTEKSPP